MTQQEKKLEKILEELVEAVKYGEDATDAEKALGIAKSRILHLFRDKKK